MKVKNNLNTKSVSIKLRAAVGLFAHTEAKRMEGMAKREASWTDRTSNARNTILGDFFWDNNKAHITLSGNVNYFPYLELAMDKKYAVLYPTIAKHSPTIMRGFERLVK